MNIEKSISATKREFEHSFSSPDYYNKQTQDEQHLKSIIEFLPVKPGMQILDLGTGSGYLAFPIAKLCSGVSVIGLDIVEKALEANRVKAEKEKVANVSFITYDGICLPFAGNTFDIIVSRYALHHFPDIQKSISEACRVLKPGGFLFISDPAPNDNDTGRFVDAYMQLKQDGHIKFYTRNEWKETGEKAGLQFVKYFDSSIRFPKKREAATGFDELLKRHDETVIQSYGLEVVGDEIYITEKVNNLLFRKQ